MTGWKLDRNTLANDNCETAVDPQTSERVVYDDGFAGKPVTVQTSGNVDWCPRFLATILRDVWCHSRIPSGDFPLKCPSQAMEQLSGRSLIPQRRSVEGRNP